MKPTLAVCHHCNQMNRVSIENAKRKKAICGNCTKELPLHGAACEVNEDGLKRILAKSDRPVVVDFWAEWCGPCKMYSPQFEQASLQTDEAIFLKVDTEKNHSLGQSLHVSSIPLTIVFKNGQEVKRQAGAMPLKGILTFINI